MRIQLKTGEWLTVHKSDGLVTIKVDGHRDAVTTANVADCLDTFAAQFTTLGIELMQMASFHRKQGT